MSTATAPSAVAQSSRFRPRLSAEMCALVEGQIGARGASASAVIRRAVTDYLATDIDVPGLQALQTPVERRTKIEMRFPHELLDRVIARAAHGTQALELAGRGPVRPVTPTDVLIAALNATRNPL